MKLIKTKQASSKYGGFFTRELDKVLVNAPYPRKDNVIRPSEIAYCKRWIVGDILGLAPVRAITPQQNRIFNNGSYVHKRYLTNYITKMGIAARLIDYKTGKARPFVDVTIAKKELWLRGAPDAVIVNPENGLLYVFELKSINEFSFNKLTEPEKPHLWQLHLYMHMTDIERGIVFYESKNSQSTKEFEVSRDPAIIELLLARIAEIQKYVSNFAVSNELPTCENEFSACMCDSINLGTGGV